jgi:hypothetical protein
MERPQTVAEFEMIFWMLYGLAFLACAVFFVWSLLRYAIPNRLRRKTPAFSEPVGTTTDLVAEIIALQAQFIVAPHMAISEAKKLLEDRHAALQLDSSADLPAQFEALTRALAHSKSFRELREV